MKSSSDHYPELTVQSAGKTQIRYNIVETTKEDMDGSTKTSYNFDFVEVEGEVTKEKIIEAMLAAEEPVPEIVKPIKEPKPEVELPSPQIVEEAITEAKVIIAAKEKPPVIKDPMEKP